MWNETDQRTVLVLGASSWLGYELIQKIASSKYTVVGTVFKSTVNFAKGCRIERLPYSVEAYARCINEIQPDVIINFLRGEDEIGSQIHQLVINFSAQHNSHYVYASSALALDGYSNTALTEELKAKSNSPYGQFKANCEQKLTASVIDYTILRFASVQGWVPHKATRNQVLLEKLEKKIPVIVDRGVRQNRILASLLIEGICLIIRDKVTGIVHFGSQDDSEEYHFLQAQAELFGYDKQQIKAGQERQVNLVVIPKRMISLYGDKFVVYEKDTLHGLVQLEGLKKHQHEG